MKDRIAFLWQGFNGMYGKWHDGLYLAMKKLEDEYDITYLDPRDNIDGYDLLIYWEAPCTILGLNADVYKKVQKHPTKKILLFAGGPVKQEWVEGFDHVCVESKINYDEFKQLGFSVNTAFGINEELFQPIKTEKKFKAVHHGTSASWKRQWLMAEAFGEDSLLIGRYQQTDPRPFDESKKLGATILGELHDKELVKELCTAEVLAQTSDYWGGGQRATLEAMALGLPVICMEDSPKNREYVEESGAGVVCSHNPVSIREAYDKIKTDYKGYSDKGISYVKSKWTSDHYKNNLKEAIELCIKK